MQNNINPEVRAFLEGRHPNYKIKDVAAVMHVTPQAMSQMLNRNMFLASAERIAEAYGYSLELVWPKKTYPEGYVPELCSSPAEATGNLRGLAQYIYDSHLTPYSVAVNAGITPASLCRSLRAGNIRLFTLQRIADSLGIAPEWRWMTMNK